MKKYMKNKNLLSIVAFVGLMFVFAGCSDLDTLPDGGTVTSKQKEEVYGLNPEMAQAGVNAIFAQFSQYMKYSSRHNDFGYPTIMLATDTNGEDVISDDNGYNWTGSSLTYDDRAYTSYESLFLWNNFYAMIYTSNNVIGANDPETEDPTSQYYLAQGLAVRAFSYFGIAQLYQFNYKGNESKPCAPIITDENANEVAINGAKRSSVQEVYDLILSDLNLAIELLEKSEAKGIKRADKRYVSLAVAYGIRARVHLVMHKYPEAGSDADKAIALSDATPFGLTQANKPAFNNAEDANWMWGIIIAETDRIVTSGIVNWASHMGSLNYGYANFSGGRQINKKLFATIPESDVRRGWWLDENKESVNLDAAQQATMAGYGYVGLTQVKFAPYKNENQTSTNAVDMPLMRIEEMYLIKAEADGMAGNSATLVDFVSSYRDPEYSFSGSANAIQEEILRQRRIELWGEGLIWYDYMRLNRGIDRRGAGYPNATSVFNIPAGSDILLWRLPESEIQANPALSEGDNNPTAPAPSPVADN